MTDETLLQNRSEVPNRLGMVVGGSLDRGLEVRLDPETSVEEVRLGTFVTIQGQRARYFGVVTGIALEAADPALKSAPPDLSSPLVAQVLSGTSAYGLLQVLPALALGSDARSLLEGGLQPAKTLPAFFSPVYAATQQDVDLVFGRESPKHFYIGNPLDMEQRIHLNLEELARRSNGIFGKTGTGKTFLTRLLLIGMLQQRTAVNLVFDMHSEYGWRGRDEGSDRWVKGLKQLFSSRVAVFSLDEELARWRGFSPDYLVRIPYEAIEPEDIEMLAETLNLTPIAAQSVHHLPRHLGKAWLGRFLELRSAEELYALAHESGEHEATIQALRRRLERLERMPFLQPRVADDMMARLLEYLERGIHVVLEFGRHGNDLAAYVLVANLLTRRIHDNYVRRMEQSVGDQAREPRPLVITVEEAHRFLGPGVAHQTAFGTIAREMRKYNVTLLVVDQRPSGIDEEVMSQLGTRLCCLLDNQRDIDAVVAGAPGARELRTVLARLESKQQALIFGHAVPMPVVVRVRDYGSADSYRELGLDQEPAQERTRQSGQNLWG